MKSKTHEKAKCELVERKEMIKEIVTLFLILTVSIVSYTWCAIRADKARRYHEKQGDKATEVLAQVTKLWSNSAATHKRVTKCENCHENTAMTMIDHKLLCRGCYEQIEVEE